MLIKFVGDIYPPWGLSLYQDPPSLYLTKVIVTTVTLLRNNSPIYQLLYLTLELGQGKKLIQNKVIVEDAIVHTTISIQILIPFLCFFQVSEPEH